MSTMSAFKDMQLQWIRLPIILTGDRYIRHYRSTYTELSYSARESGYSIMDVYKHAML